MPATIAIMIVPAAARLLSIPEQAGALPVGVGIEIADKKNEGHGMNQLQIEGIYIDNQGEVG